MILVSMDMFSGLIKESNGMLILLIDLFATGQIQVGCQYGQSQNMNEVTTSIYNS